MRTRLTLCLAVLTGVSPQIMATDYGVTLLITEQQPGCQKASGEFKITNQNAGVWLMVHYYGAEENDNIFFLNDETRRSCQCDPASVGDFLWCPPTGCQFLESCTTCGCEIGPAAGVALAPGADVGEPCSLPACGKVGESSGCVGDCCSSIAGCSLYDTCDNYPQSICDTSASWCQELVGGEDGINVEITHVGFDGSCYLDIGDLAVDNAEKAIDNACD